MTRKAHRKYVRFLLANPAVADVLFDGIEALMAGDPVAWCECWGYSGA